MAHKTCCFLIDTSQLNKADSDLDVVTSADDRFIAAVEEVFSPWKEKHMSPTCWYTHETFLMRDGRVVQLCSDTDFLQRDQMARQWKLDSAGRNAAITRLSRITDPWLEKMILFALRRAACGLLDRFPVTNTRVHHIMSMSAKEIQTWFLDDLLAEIGRMYSPENRKSPEERMAAAATYEHFIASYLPPFTRNYCSPHEYRCFDLRAGDEDLRNVAMLITDICL